MGLNRILRLAVLILCAAPSAHANFICGDECKIECRFAGQSYAEAVLRDVDFTSAADPIQRREAIQQRTAELESDIRVLDRLDELAGKILSANRTLYDNVGTWTSWTEACEAIYPLGEAAAVRQEIVNALSPLTRSRILAIDWYPQELQALRTKLGNECVADWIDKSTSNARDVVNRTYEYLHLDLPALRKEKLNLMERLIDLKNLP